MNGHLYTTSPVTGEPEATISHLSGRPFLVVGLNGHCLHPTLHLHDPDDALTLAAVLVKGAGLLRAAQRDAQDIAASAAADDRFRDGGPAAPPARDCELATVPEWAGPGPACGGLHLVQDDLMCTAKPHGTLLHAAYGPSGDLLATWPVTA